MSDPTDKKSLEISPLYLIKNKSTSSTASTSNTNISDTSDTISINKTPIDVQCLLCDKQYTFYTQKDDYLAHLFLEHRLVIADEEQVAIFHEYLHYWRDKLEGDPKKLPEYCTTMHLDHLPDGTPSPQEKYYLLADILPQDNELRYKLYTKRLEMALAQHQYERIDTTFERVCLYCRDIIKTTRTDYLEHLFSKHFLQLGKSENLVYIDDLIDTVQNKMLHLICLFCEKEFKDRPTLKEHMRKKGHKRINPDNKSYDRFFLINYKNEKQSSYGQRSKYKPNTRMKSGKSHHYQQQQLPQQQGQHGSHDKKQQSTKIASPTQAEPKSKHTSESNVFNPDHSDTEWSDWEGEQQVLTCLYCAFTTTYTEFGRLKMHMKDEHGVDFDRATQSLSFYDRVKIVNFVRRQMHLLKCLTCGSQFKVIGELQKHLQDQQHYGIGERKQWDLAEYYFPTYEDDAFLCSLDDTYDTDDDTVVVNNNDASVVVHSEDTKICINADAEALSKEQLLKF